MTHSITYRLTTKCAAIAAIVSILGLSGCTQAIQPDPNPPRVYILKWERNGDGTQGAQTTVNPGGQFAASPGWLGPNQADIRVYGDSAHGVTSFQVTGSAMGTCSTKVDSHGQFFTAPGPLSASFPTYTDTAPSGTARDFMALHLDGSLLTGNSCGTHSYNGAPPGAEYFLDVPATWTINASDVNGSALQATGTFTIKLQ